MDIPQGVNFLQYTWDDFGEDRSKMARLIKGHEVETGIKFSRVYGVPRGGLVLAVCLSHDLDLEFLASPPRVYDPHTIIVDEVAEKGTTLKPFVKMGFITATIHYLPESMVIPNLWIREKEPKTWIVYCWEKQEGSGS